MKTHNLERFMLSLGLALAGGLLLAGCQPYWAEEPGFGDRVNAAVQQQTANPNNPSNSTASAQKGMDGVAAKDSIDNYQKSFETKPGVGANAYPSTPLGGGVR
jgi:hypothetical protein